MQLKTLKRLYVNIIISAVFRYTPSI